MCTDGATHRFSLLVTVQSQHFIRATITGNHVLVAACCGGHTELAEVRNSANKIRWSERPQELRVCANKNMNSTTHKELLKAGAPIELKNNIGTSPLWLACGYGHLATAKLLLRCKANPDAQNLTGE